MTTVQANLWQDGCGCRKGRTPKIGDIPRHTALDVDAIKPQSESAVRQTTPPFHLQTTEVPPLISNVTRPASTASNVRTDVRRLLVDAARARAGIARSTTEASRRAKEGVTSKRNDSQSCAGPTNVTEKSDTNTNKCSFSLRTSSLINDVDGLNDDVNRRVSDVNILSDGANLQTGCADRLSDDANRRNDDKRHLSDDVDRRIDDVRHGNDDVDRLRCDLDKKNVENSDLSNRRVTRKSESVIETNAVPSQTTSLDVATLNPKVLLHAKSLGCPTDNGRPIFPNCPYSPYNSPTNSPRSSRKKPLRESRRVSIEKLGTYLQLNQYKLMDDIGQGSYGIVKLAYNEEDDSHYAMKILSKKKLFKKSMMFGRLPPRKQGHSSSSPISHPLAKIYREIAILKKLDHPNIVKLVEVLDDPDEDHLYLAFELLDRGQVLEIPTSQPLDEEKAWRYFRDIVSGIEYLHFQRIVHRDIKPANLLLDDADRVQITDFGVCNEFLGADAYLSNTAGTPAFMPPEALDEDTRSGFSGKCTDIWSMGVTLFALVYGHVPFHDNTIVGVYSKIRHQEVEFPLNKSISEDLKDLVKKMLVKDPAKRITIPEIKVHPWVTKNGLYHLPSEEENCQLVEVTDEDVAKVITSIPKLDTLILIKHMLKKHSFQNPFLHRRDTTIGAPLESTKTGPATTRRHIGRSGRSNSAPDTYNWMQHKQVSVDSPLESVTEVNLDEVTGVASKVPHTTRPSRKHTTTRDGQKVILSDVTGCDNKAMEKLEGSSMKCTGDVLNETGVTRGAQSNSVSCTRESQNVERR